MTNKKRTLPPPDIPSISKAAFQEGDHVIFRKEKRVVIGRRVEHRTAPGSVADELPQPVWSYLLGPLGRPFNCFGSSWVEGEYLLKAEDQS